jgi:hypothetical protein
LIIGISGRIGAGKTTTSLLILDLIEFAERRPFALKLKESCAALLGLTVSQVDTWKNDIECAVNIFGKLNSHPQLIKSMPFREILQRYGTEAHRDIFGQDFWLEQALPSDEDYSGKLVIVDDLRFINELDHIKKLGGKVWFIDRPHSAGNTEFGKHPSESHLIELHNQADVVILNTKRIVDLEEEVKKLLFP